MFIFLGVKLTYNVVFVMFGVQNLIQLSPYIYLFIFGVFFLFFFTYQLLQSI